MVSFCSKKSVKRQQKEEVGEVCVYYNFLVLFSVYGFYMVFSTYFDLFFRLEAPHRPRFTGQIRDGIALDESVRKRNMRFFSGCMYHYKYVVRHKCSFHFFIFLYIWFFLRNSSRRRVPHQLTTIEVHFMCHKITMCDTPPTETLKPRYTKKHDQKSVIKLETREEGSYMHILSMHEPTQCSKAVQ